MLFAQLATKYSSLKVVEIILMLSHRERTPKKKTPLE
jgi:hypothetical protein